MFRKLYIAYLNTMASKKKCVGYTLSKGDSSIECSVPVGVAADAYLRAAEASLLKLAAAPPGGAASSDDDASVDLSEESEDEGEDLEACADEDDAESSPVPTEEDLKFLKTHPDDRLAKKLRKAADAVVESESSEESADSEESDEEDAVSAAPPPRPPAPPRAAKDNGEAVREIQARLLSVDAAAYVAGLKSPVPKKTARVINARVGPKAAKVRFDPWAVSRVDRDRIRSDLRDAKRDAIDVTEEDVDAEIEAARRAHKKPAPPSSIKIVPMAEPARASTSPPLFEY